jgi:hypothetical protein
MYAKIFHIRDDETKPVVFGGVGKVGICWDLMLVNI